MKTVVLTFPSMAVRRRKARRFSRTLLFLFLGLCATVARGGCVDDTDGEIPFTITLLHPLPHTNDFSCIFVQPFSGCLPVPCGRTSSNVNEEDLIPGQTYTFYRIKKSIFSHTGLWAVYLMNCARHPRAYKQVVRFWINEDTNRVDITIDRPDRLQLGAKVEILVHGQRQTAEAFADMVTAGENTLQAAQASTPRDLGAEAWLGDSRDPSGKPDTDMRSFIGNAGDSLIVRLEPDGKGGNNGGAATFRFLGPPTKQVTGELPLRIDVTLGATGRTTVEIEQADILGKERYRGGYTLTIESAQGTIHFLKPGDSVEK